MTQGLKCQRVQGEFSNVLCPEPVTVIGTYQSPYGEMEFALCELHFFEVKPTVWRSVVEEWSP